MPADTKLSALDKALGLALLLILAVVMRICA